MGQDKSHARINIRRTNIRYPVCGTYKTLVAGGVNAQNVSDMQKIYIAIGGSGSNYVFQPSLIQKRIK